MAQMSRRVMFTSGTMGAVAALGLSKFVDAAENDFVLDHAGREMVRLHLRGLPPATAATLMAANLRLLAKHPIAKIPMLSEKSGEPVSHLHHEMKHRHGYLGSEQDLRNLTIGLPAHIEQFVQHKVQTGRSVDIYRWAERHLDHVFFHQAGPASWSPAFGNRQPHIALAQYDQTMDSGPDMPFFTPCETLFWIQVGLGSTALFLTMSGAGAIIGGIIGTMALGITIIRHGC